ncbi:MAG: pilus (MSHA type) biogenesis protein MshL [Xanthomonadales bacterium]|nr:pilus (MSHA type) biogenesis protein MshL [Xanthomonadales bacterium]
MKFNPRHHFPAAAARHLALPVIAALLAGCAGLGGQLSVASLESSSTDALDRTGEVLAEDARRIAEHQARLRQEIEQLALPPVQLPPVAPEYDPLEDRVVTINMYDTEVGQLLWTLADQLGMNLIIDPAVLARQQRASLYLREVTAREVYNHILESFDLHGQVRGGALLVGLMEERVFNLDVLAASVGIDVSSGGNVFGSMSGGDGGGGGGGGGSGGNQLRGNFTLSGGSMQTDPFDQIEDAIERILDPGGQGSQGGQGSASAGNERDEGPVATWSLNRSSGSLFIRARPSQVRSVATLVERVQSVLGRQVLVEAQLLDVQLNDSYELGVDWNLLRDHVAGLYGSAPMIGGGAESLFPHGRSDGLRLPERSLTIPGQTIGSGNGRSMGLAYGQDSFSVALRALRSFGNVKMLSNPSIRVRNGAPAMLSVGSNIRYVSRSSSTTNVPGGSALLTTADVQTDSLFAGVVIGVLPFIREDGQVELMIHPMQTEVDPASLALIDVGGNNRVTLPVVNYKGITTTLNLQSGDTVLLGGLIDESSSRLNRGVPGLSDVPVLGEAFNDRRRSGSTRELVMVLRAHVL